MNWIVYAILCLAVVAIFCVYRRYIFALFQRRRRNRERVAYMVWTAAQRRDKQQQP